jgi:hypothetical protein
VAQTEADTTQFLHVLEETVDEGPEDEKIGTEENADRELRTRCLSSRIPLIPPMRSPFLPTLMCFENTEARK